MLPFLLFSVETWLKYTHTCVNGLWVFSILGVMVFILYTLYFLSPYLKPGLANIGPEKPQSCRVSFQPYSGAPEPANQGVRVTKGEFLSTLDQNCKTVTVAFQERCWSPLP